MRSLLLFAILASSLFCAASSAPSQFAQSWLTGYEGVDANGDHVLGFWRFEQNAPLKDSSKFGHTLTLNGAVSSPDGKLGGGLESFSARPSLSKRHAARVANSPILTPKGAFSAEMWLKPRSDISDADNPVLIDKKYVANTDYQWRLTAAEKDGSRRMQVYLGFGNNSETFVSEKFRLETDWQHVAFSYDGAGEVRFFRNGSALGSVRKPGLGPIAPGNHILSIGDRIGSNYAGFPGYIDEVRICNGALEFRPLSIDFPLQRKTWRRMETMPPVSVRVANLANKPVENLTIRIWIDGIAGSEKRVTLPSLAAGASSSVPFPFDSSLRPDTYKISAQVSLSDSSRYTSTESTDLVLVARPLPFRMPVVMWGVYNPDHVAKEMQRMKDLGFTHCLGGGADMGTIWEAKTATLPNNDDRIAATKAGLDLALANDFGIAFTLSPGHWLKERKDMRRVNRQGRPYENRSDINAALPGLSDFCFNVGASIAQTYSEFPAWDASLINTEVRDSTQISFSDFDRAAYKKFSGSDIPAEIVNKRGVDWKKLPNFPAGRIIRDDHPVRRFMHWFWTVGDGWNALHSAVHKGLHSTGRNDMWTWFDPAVRAPSVGGSGGEVDVLSQWTYTNPDPVRVSYFTDELFAMSAASGRNARVMTMTQLFWYRQQSAPKNAAGTYTPSPFEDHDPDAAYITIAPLHLREAFWSMIARPVQGIMYHGWQALVESETKSSYRHTHPDTEAEFRRLHRDILAPLGPTLRQVGDKQSDVAFLDSFTAQMFANRGGYGFSGDEAYLTVLYAGLQPKVIYEETLLAGGLDAYRVLVLADCDVLTSSVAQRIRDFRARGGIVVGDDHLAPAITADIKLDSVSRKKRGDVDKNALLAAAAKLRSSLKSRYKYYVECNSPDVITRVRSTGTSDYIFVVNDRREFGTYVGQHGLVMEHGLPTEARLSVNKTKGSVYDLVAGKRIGSEERNGVLSWPVNLGPGEGGVFLITANPIAAIRCQAPSRATLGSSIESSIEIVDAEGNRINGVIPLRVEIIDPAGRRAERSGYYGAQNGQLILNLDLASNDVPGIWALRVVELASGTSSAHYVRVVPVAQASKN